MLNRHGDFLRIRNVRRILLIVELLNERNSKRGAFGRDKKVKKKTKGKRIKPGKQRLERRSKRIISAGTMALKLKEKRREGRLSKGRLSGRKKRMRYFQMMKTVPKSKLTKRPSTRR